VELQVYTLYRVPTVGPPCSVPLRNWGSSLLRRRSRQNRLAICLFGPCAVPSPRLLPLRLSSGGFEQLRPSLGLLRNLSSSLATERLRRCSAKVASLIDSRVSSGYGLLGYWPVLVDVRYFRKLYQFLSRSSTWCSGNSKKIDALVRYLVLELDVWFFIP
jgi:hypothetical protein